MLPHTPSRFTGTIGASTPFMMRSMPRRNGSNWPMRVICPSAKMQTTSPFLIALRGFAQRMDHFARPLLGGNRNRADDFRERLDVRQIVDRLVDQETDRPVGGSDEQQRIHERHVIADEQRAARFGNVLAPFDANAIDRVRRSPEHEPHQRIRQQVDGIGGGDEGQNRAVEENSCAQFDEEIRENT